MSHGTALLDRTGAARGARGTIEVGPTHRGRYSQASRLGLEVGPTHRGRYSQASRLGLEVESPDIRPAQPRGQWVIVATSSSGRVYRVSSEDDAMVLARRLDSAQERRNSRWRSFLDGVSRTFGVTGAPIRGHTSPRTLDERLRTAIDQIAEASTNVVIEKAGNGARSTSARRGGGR
jgi:hypothetical protein